MSDPARAIHAASWVRRSAWQTILAHAEAGGDTASTPSVPTGIDGWLRAAEGAALRGGGKAADAAAAGCALGTVLATLAMIPINLVVLRLELGLMPDAVMAMMIPAILPFNLLKGVLNSVIYFVAGRPLSRVMARYQQSGGNRHE